MTVVVVFRGGPYDGRISLVTAEWNGTAFIIGPTTIHRRGDLFYLGSYSGGSAPQIGPLVSRWQPSRHVARPN